MKCFSTGKHTVIQEHHVEPNYSALSDYILGCSTARECVAMGVLILNFLWSQSADKVRTRLLSSEAFDFVTVVCGTMKPGSFPGLAEQ